MVSKQCGRLFLSSLKQNEIYSKLIPFFSSMQATKLSNSEVDMLTI